MLLKKGASVIHVTGSSECLLQSDKLVGSKDLKHIMAHLKTYKMSIDKLHGDVISGNAAS